MRPTSPITAREGGKEENVKYVLMFVETEEFAKELAAMSEPDRQEAFERVGRWFADHAAHITHHAHLGPAEAATTVRLDGSADAVVTDGPFVEGKEVVSGYAEIEVADLDQALAIARTWPACPVVEIRPIT
ncbi:YciI family protein [Spirillospora sp. NPDC029432]|uniref:YciI family protein n=1 Tax=Spirillospora sp. NPDC029432 TaxID=3154599 RepID=UPI0034546AD6